MDPSVKLPFAKSHAFIIGINDYAHITPLKTAVNDAKGIAQRLETQHDYVVHGPLLNPSKEDLTKLFTETMPGEIGSEDRIVFYFAGHGIALDGEEGPNGYIVPADAKQGDKESLIPMDLLHKTLHELPCKHGLLILDCCFSGAFKWSTGYRDVIFDLPKVIYEERFWRYVKDPAWQVITSSAYDQKAVDVISNQSIGMREEGEGMHSPFAKALFEAIDGAGDVIPADQGDGVITASELYAYLRDSVENQTNQQSKRQSPSMFNLSRHDKGEFIFLNPRHRFNLPPTPDRNPFMGLASYNEADSNFFFGRDRVTEALLEKVQNNPLTVVSGASGTGKSSVIKAGLLPILRKKGWELLPVIRPGKEPMQVLGKELPDMGRLLNPNDTLQIINSQFEELLNDSSNRETQASFNKKFLLIIDQYEELISQCLKAEDRLAFESQLADWLTKYPNLHIILSVRSDFEPQFDSAALAPWWQKGRYVVPAFSMEEIREVISKPALQAILFYEPLELMDKLEEDVSQAPGALPLLSFTLSELYYAYLKSGREDRALTLEDYEAMGGVIGALRSKADEVYLNKGLNQELNQIDAHQSSMRKLMLRMVSLEGEELAGKRVYTDELNFSNEEETERIKTVASQLVDARLVVQGNDLQGRSYLEPAHDALVRAWARLWEWIKAIGKEKLIWQNKLSQAVVDYHELESSDSKKAEKLLWNNNPSLPLLMADLGTQTHGFNAKEEAFILASEKLKKRKRQQFIGTFVGVAVVIIGIGFYAFTQFAFGVAKTAESEARNLVVKAKAIQQSNRPLALNLAKLAWEKTDAPLPEVQQALFEIYTAQMGKRSKSAYLLPAKPLGLEWFQQAETPVKFAAFSPDGNSVLTLSESGELNSWDREGNKLFTCKSPDDSIQNFQFSRDGNFLLGCGLSGIAYVWNKEGTLLNTLQSKDQLIKSAFFSADGMKILSCTELGRVSFWTIDGTLIRSIETRLGLIREVVWGDSPTILYARTRSGLQIWDTEKIDLKASIFNDGRSSISSKGTYYWGSNSVSNLLWMTHPNLFPIEQNPGSTLNDVISSSIETVAPTQAARFSQNEQLVVLPHSFHLQLYKLQGSVPQFLRELDYGISSLTAIAPNAQHLLVSTDRGLFVHDHEGHLLLDLGVQSANSKALYFSPDNQHFLSLDGKKALLWNLKGNIVKELFLPGKNIQTASFSLDGSQILTQTEDGIYTLWGSLPGPCENIELPELVADLAISQDASSLLMVRTISNDSLCWKFDGSLASGDMAKDWFAHAKRPVMSQMHDKKPLPFGLLEQGKTLSSPNNTYTLTVAGSVAFLSNQQKEILAELSLHTDQIERAVFSEDERYLITTSRDNTVKIWPTPLALYQWLLEAPLPKMTYVEKLKYLEGTEEKSLEMLDNKDLVEMASYLSDDGQEELANTYFQRVHTQDPGSLSMQELRRHLGWKQKDFFTGENLSYHLTASIDSCDGGAFFDLLHKMNKQGYENIPSAVLMKLFGFITESLYTYAAIGEGEVSETKAYPLKCFFELAEGKKLLSFKDEYDFIDSLIYVIQPFIFQQTFKDPELVNLQIRLLLIVDNEKKWDDEYRFNLDSLQSAWLASPLLWDLEFINDLLNDSYGDLILLQDDYDGKWILNMLEALLRRLNEIKTTAEVPAFTSLEPLLKIYLFAEVFNASLDSKVTNNPLIQEAIRSQQVHELRVLTHAINEFMITGKFDRSYQKYAQQLVQQLHEIDTISLYERILFLDSEPNRLMDLKGDYQAMLYAAQYFNKNEEKEKAKIMLSAIPPSGQKQISLENRIEIMGYQLEDVLKVAQNPNYEEFASIMALLDRENKIAISGKKGRSPKGKPKTFYFGDYFKVHGVVVDEMLQPIPSAQILSWDWGHYLDNQDLKPKENVADLTGKFEFLSHTRQLKIMREGFEPVLFTIQDPGESQLIILPRSQ